MKETTGKFLLWVVFMTNWLILEKSSISSFFEETVLVLSSTIIVTQTTLKTAFGIWGGGEVLSNLKGEKTFQKWCPGWGSNSRPSDCSLVYLWLWDWRATYCATEALEESFIWCWTSSYVVFSVSKRKHVFNSLELEAASEGMQATQK